MYIELIKNKLLQNEKSLKAFWEASFPVKHFFLDDLLPIELAEKISKRFPSLNLLSRYDTLRERKSIGIEMNKYHSAIGEITFAFQDAGVLEIVGRITEIEKLGADENLYSSGVSAMKMGDYLNPHIDNSSNPFIKQYRRINALYYVGKGWEQGFGGELELWNSKRADKISLSPNFNRVIFMNTNRTSFHSVSPLKNCGDYIRNCISNYYFSPFSPENYEYFHVTSFRGRPENPIQDALLKIDGSVRNLFRKIKPREASDITHVYKK